MRRLGLDFQPRRPGLLPLALLLAAGLLCLDAGLDLQAADGEIGEKTERLAAAEARVERLRRAAHPAAATARSPEQEKALRQAAAALAVDWESLYRAIDRATGEDVALLAIVPDGAGRSVQIGGEARSLKAALAFVEALPGTPLGRASLLSHRVKTDDPQRPVVFEAVAHWEGARR